MTTARVNILMCVRDDESMVGMAIESLLSQTFSDFELVIADAGASDGTAAVIHRFGDDPVRLIPGGDGGNAPVLTESLARRGFASIRSY